MSATGPLKLSEAKPFGIGGRRLCFVHPEDPGKCVKVLRTDDKRTVRLAHKKRIMPSFLRREYDNNADELKELRLLEAKLGRSAMSKHFPCEYGMHATDLGPGLVLDLIRDNDGGISRSIRELITNGLPLSSLRSAFESFGKFLLAHHLVTRQLLDHNIAASQQSDGGWNLYLIDGLGDRAWLSPSRWIKPFARHRIQKNLDRAWARFEEFAQSGGVTKEMIQNSTWGQGILSHRDQ